MQKILGFVLSIAVGLLMSAAGLYFDFKTLAVAGFILLGFVVAAWLFAWGTGIMSPRPPASPAPMQVSDEALAAASRSPEEQEAWVKRRRAIEALEHALHAAVGRRTQSGALRAIPELDAAILTAHKQFDIPVLTYDGDPVAACDMLRHYIEIFLPHLRLGHDAEAVVRAKAFSVDE